MRKSDFFFLCLGAIPGALLRWQLNNHFLGNIIGCFIIGFIYSFKLGSRLRLIFALGFCGALTSFSSWIVDCLELLLNGNYSKGILILISMLISGLISVSLGYVVGKKLFL